MPGSLYTRPNALRGLLIYASGDTVAAFLLGQFTWGRLIGIMLVGATFYALEIPNYFRWIDRRTANRSPWHAAMERTGLALLYFNPLWIARHLLFIALFSGRCENIRWHLLLIATRSFLVNIPISFSANFIIQNRVKLKWRFVASAVFSALMAIYYALSEVIFR